MSALTEQHIAVLRALVDRARATNSDVGMDASVLAALLNERDGMQIALAAAEQLAAERLALITAIETAIDDGDNWQHTYDGDDESEWVNCEGRDMISELIASYREGPESQVKP